MKTRQRITLAATVAAAIAGVLTPSASATPLSATLAYGGTAPACIVRSFTQLRHEQWIDITNECYQTMRVKVLVKGWWGKPCVTLKQGEWRSYTIREDRYDKTVVC